MSVGIESLGSGVVVRQPKALLPKAYSLRGIEHVACARTNKLILLINMTQIDMRGPRARVIVGGSSGRESFRSGLSTRLSRQKNHREITNLLIALLTQSPVVIEMMKALFRAGARRSSGRIVLRPTLTSSILLNRYSTLGAKAAEEVSSNWRGTTAHGGNTKNYIGGEFQESSASKWLEVKDPVSAISTSTLSPAVDSR